MIKYKIQLLLIALVMMLTASNQSRATETSFPMPKVELAQEKTIHGRKVLRYEHQNHENWGYSKPQRDYFNLVLPVKTTKNVPLRVILHSAGGSGDRAMILGLTKNEAKMMHYYADERFYSLYLDCRQNKKTDWWWGYHLARRSGNTYKERLTPTEKRLLSTIEWVVKEYDIDRNRIYLSGVSMGGSGSLGLGLCRGDIFCGHQCSCSSRHRTYATSLKQHHLPRPASGYKLLQPYR